MCLVQLFGQKLSGNVPLERKMGSSTELSTNEETVLVNWILAMTRKGFPVHRTNLLMTVKKIFDETGKETRYISNDGTPGRSWFEGFLRRHPNIKERYAESVSKARAAWFEEIEGYLKEEKLEQILEDPTRIFNGDEKKKWESLGAHW
ncbi:hth cenpb-type dna-binding domain [Holotrichia oblita]|uniref:Hth cenpb-type dna-binding domain n=1 Tax=Holotrichia oblita TaxID=644536 RepID=A0ACB9T8U3_HOLOL|nr:hth cenpb-type dna-binding domain [Holotrichia oblita]